jgi:hypothetical protein
VNPTGTRNSKQRLAVVLNGMADSWSNSHASVHYSVGTWVWFTPTGVGQSDDWMDALIAVADHLTD